MPAGAASPRWWIASAVFHVLLLGWVFFFAPVHVIDPARNPAAKHASAERAREVIEQIREKQADSIEENLRTLQEIAGRISELEKSKRAEFGEFAREMGKDAPRRAAAEQQTIAQAQAEVLALLDGADKSLTGFVQTRTNADYDDLADAQKSAREKQPQIVQKQEQAMGVLSVGGDRFATARAAQIEATAAQESAEKALVEAEAARQSARGSRQRTARERELEHFTYHLKRSRETLQNADANFADLRKKVATAGAVAAATKAAATQAAARAAAENSDAARTASEAAQKSADRADKEFAAAQKRLDNAPKESADAKKKLPELEAKVAELLAQADPEAPAPTPADENLSELQTNAHHLQLAARDAQQKVADALAALPSIAAESSGGDAALAALDSAAPAAPLPPLSSGTHAGIARLYDDAVKTETVLTQSYRRLRATDLAMIRRIPIEKAVQLTEVAAVVRPDLKAALGASVLSGDDVPAAREAVQTAKAEIGAMVRLASSLLSQAQGFDKTAGSTISVEDYNAKFDQWEKMQALAAEDEGQWAKDLTGAMSGADTGDGNAPGGANDKGSGGPGGAAGGGTAGAGSGRPGGGSGTAGNGGAAGTPDLGTTGIAGPFGVGAGPGGFGTGGIPGAHGAMGAPEDISGRVVPFPGRRVAARGASARWFFADSWYILGPFDNTRRANIDRKFPPETVIDLNATYPGKNGVPIRWEFHQFGQPNITPPLDAYNAAVRDPALSPTANYGRNLEYIIYYAYTELWFEKACDLWVAIGSDDFSKVWIEDQLVWSSGKNLKPWRLNEGLRKVHFKAGINRVLYRVENGNSKTEFSLVVSLQP
jgi:hypothetical protein